MTELRAGWRDELGDREVRVVTLDTGDSATVRAAARELLAPHAGIAAADLEIVNGEKGKPTLRSPADLYFSISHAEGISMVAITRVAHIGVDIERIRAVPKAARILERFFTPEQTQAILSDDERDLRFLETWTRAEAAVKVRGASVWEAATRDPNVVVRVLSAPERFAAAVAVAARDWTVNQLDVATAELLPHPT